MEQVLGQHSLLLKALPDTTVFVSIKANPNPRLVAALGAAGANFDAASEIELELALSSRVRDSLISIVGPGKSKGLIQASFERPVDFFIAESVRDLKASRSFPRKSAGPPSVLLRVNPTGLVAPANEVMGGMPSQFGVDEECIQEVANTGMLSDIRGLHYFLGSQIRRTEDILLNLRTILESVQRLIGSLPTDLEYLNLGGGFGVAHSLSDESVNLSAVSEGVLQLAARLSEAGIGPQLLIEAGRFIFAESGIYLARVLDTKISRGRKYVILESGISGFSRPALRWGESHPIWKVHSDVQTGEPYSVVGPTCLPGDVLADQVLLENPRVGDLIAVGNAGAYGSTMSLSDWGSIAQAREYVL